MTKPIWGRSKEEIDQACAEYGNTGGFDNYGIGAHALVPTPRADGLSYDGPEVSFGEPAQPAVEVAPVPQAKPIPEQAAAVAIENA